MRTMESNIIELIVGTAFLGWNAYLHNQVALQKAKMESLCGECAYDFTPKKEKKTLIAS